MASSYQLQTVRSDIRLLFPDDSQFTDDQIDRRVNETIIDIAYNAEIPELEGIDSGLSLATSTRSYSMSTFDPLLVISVKNTTQDTVLEPISKEDAEAWDEDETGEPTSYFRYGTNLRVYPLPSSDYNGDTLRVLYQKKPTTMTNDTDTSGLPNHFDEAIKRGALARLYLDSDEPDRAASHYRVYLGILNARGDIRGKESPYLSKTLGPILMR